MKTLGAGEQSKNEPVKSYKRKGHREKLKGLNNLEGGVFCEVCSTNLQLIDGTDSPGGPTYT